MYFVLTKLFFVDDEFQDSIIRNLKFNICSFIHILIQIYTEHLYYMLDVLFSPVDSKVNRRSQLLLGAHSTETNHQEIRGL